MSGTLKTFSHFAAVNETLKDFFKKKKPGTTPIYHREISEDITFGFYQDAIINGRLINTTNKDTSKVTHPNFFKNLMSSCRQMSHFFQIDQMPIDEDRQKNFLSQDLLGIKFEPEDQYSYILILDYRNRLHPRLDFVPADSWKSKLNEYGRAFCSYFGLIPKIKNTNVNLFRYFFKTTLGRQILNLSVNGSFSKLRAKTGSLLVPKFFEQTKLLPKHIQDSLHIYHCSVKDLLHYDSEKLIKEYLKVERYIFELSATYPWHTMGMMVFFDQKIDSVFDSIEIHQNFFENQKFVQSLLKCDAHPIYPDNPEVFIKFHIKGKEDLHKPLESVTVQREESVKKGMYALKLRSASEEALSFYSDKNVIKFLEFILNQMIGVKMTDILSHTKVPKLKDLNKLIENQTNAVKKLKQIKSLNEKMILEVINRQLY